MFETKTRIVETVAMSGKTYFMPQARIWFLWQDLSFSPYDNLASATNAVNEYKNRKKKVVEYSFTQEYRGMVYQLDKVRHFWPSHMKYNLYLIKGKKKILILTTEHDISQSLERHINEYLHQKIMKRIVHE